MASPHAQAGEVMDVRPLGAALASAQTKTLLRTEQVEVRRLVAPAGKEIKEHKAKGEIVVQCLEGKVAYTAFGKTHHLEAGQLFYLPTGEPHSVPGIENASLRLTILLPKRCVVAGGDCAGREMKALPTRAARLGSSWSYLS